MQSIDFDEVESLQIYSDIAEYNLQDCYFFNPYLDFLKPVGFFPELKPLVNLADEIGVKSGGDFGCIIANLYAAFLNKKPLGCYRDKNRVSSAFLGVLDALTAWGYVEYRRGYNYAQNARISRYWARGKLLDVFCLICTGQLKDYVPPVVQMTEREGKKARKIQARNKPSEVVQREADLREYNKLLNKHIFSLFGNLFYPYLTAVYCNKSYAEGGRLYSVGRRGTACYQGFSGVERLQIKIDFEDVTELDFKCLHPHLLYAERGLQLRGDAYGFSSALERPLAKLLLLVAFNAESDRKVCAAFNDKINHMIEKQAEGTINSKDLSVLNAFYAVRGKLSAYKVAERLLKQAKKYHSQIADAFGSGAGTHLQNVDANIMQIVINQCVIHNIPVLPVHDSVVCKIKDTEYVQAVMYQAFRDMIGFVCPVENKRTDEVFNPLHIAA